MRIVWVTRSFLDYRIPVYKAVSELANDNFFLIFSKKQPVNPSRVVSKAIETFKERAIAMDGEFCIGKPYNPDLPSNSVLRYYHQPGLRKKIVELKPDVIITDAFNHWTVPVLSIRAFSPIKHVMCYERTLHTERRSKWYKRLLRKLAFQWIDAINCNGILCKKYLQYLGFPTNKIFMGNMAADSKGLEEAVSKMELSDIELLKKEHHIQGPIFLYAGKIITQKGIFEMLRAWKQFSESITGPSLVLLGGGAQEDQVKNLIQSEDIKNVYLIGNVDYSEIAKYYAFADIFIMPTLDDNWSLVVPEAMSVGLPIICSQYNGCWPELVKPENGWVFDPLNHDHFVHTLHTAWASREKWKAMGQESFQIVQDYTPEKIAANIYQTITQISNHV